MKTKTSPFFIILKLIILLPYDIHFACYLIVLEWQNKLDAYGERE
jgi:hypothetical protein